MIKINLLPWRETLRTQNKIAFKRALILFGIVTFILFILIYFFSSSHNFGSYEKSQKLLTTEINQIASEVQGLQKNLKIKNETEKEIAALYALNYQRYQTIRFFNALTDVVPKGILLNKVIKNGNSVIVSGDSSSNALISTFLKNIQSESVVSNPILTEAKTPDENITNVIRFEIQFSIVDKESKLGTDDNGGK